MNARPWEKLAERFGYDVQAINSAAWKNQLSLYEKDYVISAIAHSNNMNDYRNWFERKVIPGLR